MKSLIASENKQEIISRINSLSPSSKGQWGKMDVGQMLAHCTKPIELALTNPKPPRQFMGRLFGKSTKPAIMGPKPFKQNGFTPKEFRAEPGQDFAKQKEKLITLVNKFTPENISDTNHPFFGPLELNEWGEGNFKHLDWHLTQFGV